MLRRKLVINLLIIVLCGTVALSIPVIVKHMQKSAQADSNQNQLKLVCKFVGDNYQTTADASFVWQIYQKRGNTIVNSWDDIFAAISPSNRIIYDHEHLQLTHRGLWYRGIETPDDYQALTTYSSYVTYQGQTCLLKLP